ncbi:MAG: hypothetical protein U5L07_07950 [Desulfobacterales bacterium]|nr:hypothetical protein [Desulfobacterales bacterium]
MKIKRKFIQFTIMALTVIMLFGCNGGSSSSGSDDDNNGGTEPVDSVLSGDITSDMTLTADTLWELSGLVVVKDGATLTIEPGTTIIGQSGTGTNTSYMIIDKGARIIADGTAANPIVFTSKIAHDGGAEAPGQWGGLTIIGNAADVGVSAGEAQVQPYEVNTEFVPGSTDAADNSGVLRYVEILNSGITMEQDKEINGLSLVGVGSGTTVDHVTVKRSDDDGIEIWGGTVNLSNCTVEYTTDDQFDIDDGYSGTVTNLTINQVTDGNAGIEMSGTTAATFKGLKLTQNFSDKEGAIFFKKDGIGGHFENCQIIDNVDDGQTIVSQGAADEFNISFENVTITSPDAATNFADLEGGTGSADIIEARFDAGVGNEEISNKTEPSDLEILAGDIIDDMTLTADTVWQLSGLVVVTNGATLTIEPGTTIIGESGTGVNTSYMIIDKDGQIMADGTAANPIVFTSKIAHDGGAEAPGQWGGLTIIGNAADVGVSAGEAQVQPYEVNTEFVPGSTDAADNSGVLRYVEILNSGITMEQDKEINGLSLVGVGSGTTVDHVTVKRSDDDGIEIWGGTVNLSNCTVEYTTDDQFDIDDGYSGTVTNLTINQVTDGNAGIEMSGTTAATFKGLKLTQNFSDKEGAIFFKKDGIGGHFENCQIIDNVDDGQTIVSQGAADEFNISFENVTITSPDAATNFADLEGGTGSADIIEARFDAGVGNEEISNKTEPLDIEILAGDIIDDTTLTADTVWQLSGLVVVTNGATLTIEPGTTIIGESGTGVNTSYMIIDKDGQIMADGTAANPIVFTSKTAYDGGAEAPGQWGGLTIIGNAADVGVAPGDEQVEPYEVNTLFVPGNTDAADNSGILRHVHIVNSGITMEQDKEINGLSCVGVGSGTVIDHVSVIRSDDDGIELWGGTVDVSNAYIEYTTDDYFDIDDGYSGTVTNLTINQHTDGNAGIEMSGSTAATFEGLELTQNFSDKEGAIFFKKDGIGGHFIDCEIIDNVDDGVTIYSQGDADEANISFENVTITSPDIAANFADADSGGSAADIEAAFDDGVGNSENLN